MARIVKLIYTEERTGLGKNGDPIRPIYQLFTMSGELVASYDPHTEEAWAHPEKAIDPNFNDPR